MNGTKTPFPRGSEWRQWDLHVHTPASFHWTGPKFNNDTSSDHDIKLVDEMVKSFNDAIPAVFGIMDYWTFDGWFALKRRLQHPDAPLLSKVVLPGIELRLVSPTKYRLNAHVLFSDLIDDQLLRDFQSQLKLAGIDRPLSDAALRDYARGATEDILKKAGFAKSDVLQDDTKALLAGQKIAEVTADSYQKAIAGLPHDQAVGFMPYDPNDGLAEVGWDKHYAYFMSLLSSSPVFEVRNPDLRAAFVGEETDGNTTWFRQFQEGLKYVPRLAVSGSDAHKFRGVAGDNNNRGYGDFPSGRATWIKADPTFLGLLQAIKEPSKRSYIGDRPPKLKVLDENKTFFIDTVGITKNDDSSIAEEWLHGCDLPLNPDLIAIIGNKGSGKSALADVIALLGNSQQHKLFSFLKPGRFRGRAGEPAKHFTGRLKWLHSDEVSTKGLDDSPSSDVELVRYITQGHFETLCNEHVSGASNAFEAELRKVIFSHAGEDMRQGAFDFEQLIDNRERTYRDMLAEHRKDLNILNQEIAAIEEQLKPEVEKNLSDLLTLKRNQIEEHSKVKPQLEPEPEEMLSAAHAATALEVADVTQLRLLTDEWIVQGGQAQTKLAREINAARDLLERVNLLEKQIKQFETDTETSRATLGLTLAQVVDFEIRREPIDKALQRAIAEKASCDEGLERLGELAQTLQARLKDLEQQLNAPQLKYQQSRQAMEAWEKKLAALHGSEDDPESRIGLEARQSQLNSLRPNLLAKRQQRLDITGNIYDTLDRQRKAREELFTPVQYLIASNHLIRDDYKLQFIATFWASPDHFYDTLFSIIKQNSGDFRGDDKSRMFVKTVFDEVDLESKDKVIALCTRIHDKLLEVAGTGANGGVASLLRKERNSIEVYDLIFGLDFLQPRYSLRFQDAAIEQLSPGQRGALLLIFYLLVDKGQYPIILDQPEENLDNQTVVSLLVPVVEQSKAKRQIIMVTHNPNLAVVCDAEQIIYSSFDRRDRCAISYISGGIEEPLLNRQVVDVLEGTMRAFSNRHMKYQHGEN